MMDEIREDEAVMRRSLLGSTTSINCDPAELERKPGTRKEMSRSRVMKNMTIMSFSVFVFFLGFQGLANLQSTMNSAKGLGMNSQAVIYAFSMFSALLFPELLIKTFGSKKTLIFMVIFSLPYIASNYYPRFDTLIPTAFVFGLASGPLGTAQTIYVNEMSLRYYQKSHDEPLEAVMAKFYGFYSFFSENAQIWGNFVSYFVLRPGMVPIINGSHIACGIDFRPHNNDSNDSNPNLQPPSDEKRYILVSIYVFCGILSTILMSLFMDPLQNDIEVPEKGRCVTMSCRLLAAAQQACRLDQALLIPLTIFVGLEIGFYTSDFTQAYIACSWGVHHVGFVTICFGVCGAITALLVGPLVKCITQMGVLTMAACTTITTCVFLYLWQPTPDVTTIYFIFAGVWGMCDAIWWSQVTALYGLMFPNDREAAFSNFFFWSFLGYFLSYSYANVFTVAIKINILLGFLIVGMIGYYAGQMKIRCSARKDYIVIADSEE